MYAAFELKIDDDSQIMNQFKEIGKQILEENKKKLRINLKDYTNEDGSLDGTKLQSNWFPQIKADVFLSHSHKDKDMVFGVAGWLKSKFNLEVFIDSSVWGNCLDLLKDIDDNFCRNTKENSYIYERRNYSTSHVYMMLSTALTKMIDNTECIIFLNTPNSVTMEDMVKKQTISPWIYHEITMTKFIGRRSLESHRPYLIKKAFELANEQAQKLLSVRYDLELKHLEPLNQQDLTKWEKTKPETDYQLDTLYNMKNIDPGLFGSVLLEN